MKNYNIQILFQSVIHQKKTGANKAKEWREIQRMMANDCRHNPRK
jgi:hypothetical protein